MTSTQSPDIPVFNMAAKLPDLDNIIQTFAWEEMKKMGCIFSKEEVQVDIDWDNVNIISDEPEFCNKRDLKDSGSQVMHKSVFANSSDHEQKHSFQTSKQTTSVVTTTLTDGFTRGNSGIITLKVPSEVTKSTSHFGKEVIINEDGRMTRKSQAWNEFTNITAAPHKKTSVEIIVAEKRFECDFKMDVRLSGNVRVKIKHQTSGEQLMVFQRDLATILSDKSLFLSDVLFETACVIWSVAGHVMFDFGAELKTLIWCESLTNNNDHNVKELKTPENCHQQPVAPNQEGAEPQYETRSRSGSLNPHTPLPPIQPETTPYE